MLVHTVPLPGGGTVTLGCWQHRAHLAVRVPPWHIPVTDCSACGRALRPNQLAWADTATLTEPLCAPCHNLVCGHVDVAEDTGSHG